MSAPSKACRSFKSMYLAYHQFILGEFCNGERKEHSSTVTEAFSKINGAAFFKKKSQTKAIRYTKSLKYPPVLTALPQVSKVKIQKRF